MASRRRAATTPVLPAPEGQVADSSPVVSSVSTVSSVGAPDLDRVIHERLRLGIVSALAVNESLTFVELKKILGTSDGNLSVHARKLEDAGYVAMTKSFEGRMPKTVFRLTPGGRQALEKYLGHLEALIHSLRQG